MMMSNMLNKFKGNLLSKIQKKNLCQKTVNPEKYSLPTILFHWGQGAAIMTVVITGFFAGRIKMNKDTPQADKDRKGNLMHIHKSFGVLSLGLIFLRIFFRARSHIPVHNVNIVEKIAGKVSHYALYGMMVFMPVTGFGMNYLSGFPVPFFNTKIPGAPKEKAATQLYQDWKKWCYLNHVYAGKILEYMIPLHIGASVFHFARGTNVLRAMNPFTAKKL